MDCLWVPPGCADKLPAAPCIAVSARPHTYLPVYVRQSILYSCKSTVIFSIFSVYCFYTVLLITYVLSMYIYTRHFCPLCHVRLVCHKCSIGMPRNLGGHLNGQWGVSFVKIMAKVVLSPCAVRWQGLKTADSIRTYKAHSLYSSGMKQPVC